LPCSPCLGFRFTCLCAMEAGSAIMHDRKSTRGGVHTVLHAEGVQGLPTRAHGSENPKLLCQGPRALHLRHKTGGNSVPEAARGYPRGKESLRVCHAPHFIYCPQFSSGRGAPSVAEAGCDSCHLDRTGPSLSDPGEGSALCYQWHEIIPDASGRDRTRTVREGACLECHDAHTAKAQAGKLLSAEVNRVCVRCT